MKKWILIVLIILFFTNCTAIGFINDYTYPEREQRKVNRINKVEQPLNLVTRDSERIEGTFQALSYSEERKDDTTSMAQIPFLALGDTVNLEFYSGKEFSGLFRGIRHDAYQNILLIQPYWDKKQRRKSELSKVRSIENVSSGTLFEAPMEENIHVWLKSGETERDIPLNTVLYLNNQTVKQTYYRTIIGLILDGLFVYYCTQNCFSNSFSL